MATFTQDQESAIIFTIRLQVQSATSPESTHISVSIHRGSPVIHDRDGPLPLKSVRPHTGTWIERAVSYWQLLNRPGKPIIVIYIGSSRGSQHHYTSTVPINVCTYVDGAVKLLSAVTTDGSLVLPCQQRQTPPSLGPPPAPQGGTRPASARPTPPGRPPAVPQGHTGAVQWCKAVHVSPANARSIPLVGRPPAVQQCMSHGCSTTMQGALPSNSFDPALISHLQRLRQCSTQSQLLVAAPAPGTTGLERRGKGRDPVPRQLLHRSSVEWRVTPQRQRPAGP